MNLRRLWLVVPLAAALQGSLASVLVLEVTQAAHEVMIAEFAPSDPSGNVPVQNGRGSIADQFEQWWSKWSDAWRWAAWQRVDLVHAASDHVFGPAATPGTPAH